MKNINQYITEKFKINSKNLNKYNYHPKDSNELYELVKKLIKERGNNADLNDIDTSEISDMSQIFYKSKFNGDIFDWNVSNVENMEDMFRDCLFNGDISDWDVSKVKNMKCMFKGSQFNGDLSKWDVSKVKDMDSMFYKSEYTGKNGDISKWDVSNVENMNSMFAKSKFNSNLSKWKTISLKHSIETFNHCELNDFPDWYKDIHPYLYKN